MQHIKKPDVIRSSRAHSAQRLSEMFTKLLFGAVRFLRCNRGSTLRVSSSALPWNQMNGVAMISFDDLRSPLV
ncbi:MAG TPA: hypothetical protein VFN67_35555 [Polyangiales bacterium]|nr:hypothetical protein [Polyangiales bacterium]